MTAVDTNVLVALWDKNDRFNMKAQKALDRALASGSLVIAAPVYAELLAKPSRTQQMLDELFSDANIRVDWEISERVWRLAGEASQAYGVRRLASKGGESRRIVADFVIGAHALANGHSLLTFDQGFYERNFPGLMVKKPQ
jgi:predicted nucleic acid-binding protein